MPEPGVGALVTLAVVAGLVAWLLARGDDTTKSIQATGPTAVSARDLAALPSAVQHPVYWAGPKPGYTYELTRTSDDRIFIRYLPAGIPVGSTKPNYLTIGTYRVRNAFAAVRAVAKRLNVTPARLGSGGVAVQDTEHPTSVYFAYPGSDYQVEVFDPSPARARRLVLSGRIRALGPGTGPTRAMVARPRAATLQQLRALEPSLGHPVYWVGPRQGTYELTKTSDGRTYIRYLPPGTKAGDRRPYTTVGTYPLPNALGAVKAIAKQAGGETFSIAHGGLAAVDPVHPTSVYVAFPGSNYQIEVFDPSASLAHQLVSSGRVAPVR